MVLLLNMFVFAAAVVLHTHPRYIISLIYCIQERERERERESFEICCMPNLKWSDPPCSTHAVVPPQVIITQKQPW